MIDNQVKEELKTHLRSYTESITDRDARAGRNKYKCPLCGSGSKTGSGHDGAFSITDDGLAWTCFSCGKSGDIFNLIGYHEGIANFKDQVRRAAEFVGISISSEHEESKGEDKKEKQQAHRAGKDTDFLAQSKKYIKDCQKSAGKTGYFKKRGFSSEIVQRFGLGYDEGAGVIVIPYDRVGSYYSTRSVTSKAFRKPSSSEAGSEPIYNKAALRQKKPCFICEGQLDAISIMAAGEGKCNAIALGGTGDRKLIEQIEKETPACTLVLSFDNDDAGYKLRDTVSEKLNHINIPFIVAEYSIDKYPEGSRKDANDFLVSNKTQLSLDIAANIEEIERRENAEKMDQIEEHNSKSAASRLHEFLESIRKSENIECISTGFNELDKEFDGGLYPGLYFLGAISSLGKTTFLLQVADNIASGGYDVLYFSLEMSANELISKSLSRLTYVLCDKKYHNAKTSRGISSYSRYRRYSDEEKELIKRAITTYEEYAGNLMIYEGVGDIGVEQIRNIVEKHKKLTGITPVVFIDYLQILAPYDMRSTDKQNTDKAVLELKRMSRDYNTVVMAISSFNRESYASEVNMSAFKESGAIEYGSDVLLAMQPQGMSTENRRDKNIEIVNECKRSDTRDVEIKVLKNRNGKTGGRVGFKYYSLFNYFEQSSTHHNAHDTEEYIRTV